MIGWYSSFVDISANVSWDMLLRQPGDGSASTSRDAFVNVNRLSVFNNEVLKDDVLMIVRGKVRWKCSS